MEPSGPFIMSAKSTTCLLLRLQLYVKLLCTGTVSAVHGLAPRWSDIRVLSTAAAGQSPYVALPRSVPGAYTVPTSVRAFSGVAYNLMTHSTAFKTVVAAVTDAEDAPLGIVDVPSKDAMRIFGEA